MNHLKGKKAIIATVLSLLLPGAGQMYLKKFLSGILFLIIYIALFTTVYAPSIFVAGAAAVHAYASAPDENNTEKNSSVQ